MRYTLIIAVLFLFACKPDKNNNPKPEEGFIAKGKGVFICNEGNFQFGNASVSFYNSEKTEISADIFKSVNNRPLGDVCQSMLIDGERAYIVVNNSSRIEVVKLPEFTSLGSIASLTSPRYMVMAGTGKAYVSNYYSNQISIVNTFSNSVSGQIPCHGWTEQMLSLNGKIYAVNIKSEFLYVIDPSLDKVTDSIQVGAVVSGIAIDKNKQIWVSCNADKPNAKLPAIKRIDPLSKVVSLSISLADINASPTSITTNAAADSLFYSYNGIFKMSVNDNAAPATAFIPQGNKIFYGLGIDPVSGEIYVSDAIDYVQKGKVYRYSRGGNLKHEFSAGIIPGFFAFY